MPNLRIVLDEWDIQQLLAGKPVSLSGEARPNDIYLDVDHIHLERVKSTIEALIKKQKEQEQAEGG
jgi:hypothetical protein